MPAGGQLDPRRVFFKGLITEIFTSTRSKKASDAEYKLKLDPEWRARWEHTDWKLPESKTFATYCTEVRKELKDSDIDRPWSILASANPDSDVFIAPDDLPLVLTVWRYRIAHGHSLTLRQAKWVARLRHLRLWDLNEYKALDQLFQSALTYSSREQALGEIASEDSRPDVLAGHDLDADFAFDGELSEVEYSFDREALATTKSALIVSDLIAGPDSHKSETPLRLWESGLSKEIYDEIREITGSEQILEEMEMSTQAAVFAVLGKIRTSVEWELKSTDSKSQLLTDIISAARRSNWKKVNQLAGLSVKMTAQTWEPKESS